MCRRTESSRACGKRRAKAVQLQILNSSTEEEIDAAFGTLMQLQADALVVGPQVFLYSRREQLVTLAARYRIPTIHEWRGAVAAGGLISYGADITGLFRQLGGYAGKILEGAKPADLPVQQPTKSELVVNLKTAKALGLTIRPRSSPAPTRSSNKAAARHECARRRQSARQAREQPPPCACHSWLAAATRPRSEEIRSSQDGAHPMCER